PADGRRAERHQRDLVSAFGQGHSPALRGVAEDGQQALVRHPQAPGRRPDAGGAHGVHALMILRQLQELIGGIYDVSVTHDVYDFLVTSRDCLPEAARDSCSDEELIVAQDKDAVGVSLYLDPALLERLQKSNPLVRLNESNVGDYWTALEGVSHFLY